MARARINSLTMDRTRLGYAHGCFNIVGGLWPILSLRSFEAVFGPKADRWLEYTVSGLLITNGLAQLHAARRAPEVGRTIGAGTAATLLTIDVIFVPNGTIRWTYLLDGVMELGWLGLWRRTVAPADQSCLERGSASRG